MGVFAFLLFCVIVMRSLPDNQCSYGVNGKHLEDMEGTCSISSAETGNTWHRETSARRLSIQLQTFKEIQIIDSVLSFPFACACVAIELEPGRTYISSTGMYLGKVEVSCDDVLCSV